MSNTDLRNYLSGIKSQLEMAELHNLSELNSQTDLPGLGVYALYYEGQDSLYRRSIVRPIYVGKAIASGASRGNIIIRESLKSRILEHQSSIVAASNINVADFKYRYIEVCRQIDAHFIPGIESYLITEYRPLWNSLITGFGNHDPGSGRLNQRPSRWDCLHPGRVWASRLTGANHNIEDLAQLINSYYG